MSRRAEITEVARKLNLLDAGGELIKLNSLTLIDFVVALETQCNVEIPSDMLTAAVFASIDTLDRLVTSLPPGAT